MNKTRLNIILLLSLTCTFCGCKIFLPAYKNSNVKSGERVTLEFLTFDDLDPNAPDLQLLQAQLDEVQRGPTNALTKMQKQKIEELTKELNDQRAERTELKKVYASAFPPPQVHPTGLAFLAPVAAAAVGYIFDYTTKALEQEAELYQQQWKADEWNTTFWKLELKNNVPTQKATTESSEVSHTRTTTISADRTNVVETTVESVKDQISDVSTWVEGYKQNIAGFRLKRFIDKSPVPASEVTFGFGSIAGQGMFVVKPLIYECKKAKAKVLDNGVKSGLAIFPWLLKYPGTKIKTSVDVTISARWVENQSLQQATVASFTYAFPDYDLSKDLRIVAGGEGQEKMPAATCGVFAGIPVSVGPDKLPLTSSKDKDGWLSYLGVFDIKAVVTESDASNAKNQLEQLEKAISSNKTNAQSEVKSLLKE